MRRSEDSRIAIDRVEDGTPSVLAEADSSFEYLWRASKPLPKTLFSKRDPMSIECAELRPDLDPSFAIQANIVRLDDYLRLRRH